MCDNCGNLFSVNEKGWTEVTIRSSSNNAYNHGAETKHMGPCCAPVTGSTVRPRVAIEKGENPE
jgi:hypothetical protein